MPPYEPTSNALIAFMEAAVTDPLAGGKATQLDIAAGLKAAVEIDGAPLLTYLLGTLLSTRREMKFVVDVEPRDLLTIMGLSEAKGPVSGLGAA